MIQVRQTQTKGVIPFNNYNQKYLFHTTSREVGCANDGSESVMVYVTSPTTSSSSTFSITSPSKRLSSSTFLRRWVSKVQIGRVQGSSIEYVVAGYIEETCFVTYSRHQRDSIKYDSTIIITTKRFRIVSSSKLPSCSDTVHSRLHWLDASTLGSVVIGLECGPRSEWANSELELLGRIWLDHLLSWFCSGSGSKNRIEIVIKRCYFLECTSLQVIRHGMV